MLFEECDIPRREYRRKKGLLLLLKIRQVKKLIVEALSGPEPRYDYLGYARNVHYLCHRISNSTDPAHNLLALALDPEGRAFSLKRGTSFFKQVAQITVAPGFSKWQTTDTLREEFTSKQSAKRAVTKLLSYGLDGVSFASSYLALRDDRQLRDLHAFLGDKRDQLTSPDSPAREELKQRATPQLYQQLLNLAELDGEWREDDALDAYLESLGQHGSYQGSAGFTLNRDEAIRKLTDYQLGDPVLFPLFLTVGLSLAGATSINIEIDSDETWVRFEGTRLAEAFLEDIPSALLSNATGQSELSLQALGRALLQGAGQQPQTLRLETVSGAVDLRGFPESFTQVDWGPAPQSGTFYRRQRFGWQVASRYLRSRTNPHPELPELSAALRFLPLPWSLNGERHSGTLAPAGDTLSVLWHHPARRVPEIESLASRHLSPLPVSVLFCFHPSLTPRIIAVMNDMVVELPEQTTFQPSTEVIIWLPEMATDLSGRKIVESQLLSEVLSALPNLQESAWTEMLEYFGRLPPEGRAKWVGPLLQVADAVPRLLELDLLPCVAQEAISVAQWRKAKRRLFTLAGAEFSHTLLAGDPVVAARLTWLKDLTTLCLPPLGDATQELRHTAHYQRELAAWRATPQVPLAVPRGVPHGLSVTLPNGLGFLYLESERNPSRRLLAEGRVLPYIPPSGWAPPHVGFTLLADGIAMDWDWKRPTPAERVDALQAVVSNSVVKLAEAVGHEDHLQTEEQAAWFCYLLAFLKKRGVSIRRWEDLPFVFYPGLGRASLNDLPGHLVAYMQELD